MESRTLLMLGRPHSSSVCTGGAARRRVIAVSGGCSHLTRRSMPCLRAPADL